VVGHDVPVTASVSRSQAKKPGSARLYYRHHMMVSNVNDDWEGCEVVLPQSATRMSSSEVVSRRRDSAATHPQSLSGYTYADIMSS
jgi:hypothetical protein